MKNNPIVKLSFTVFTFIVLITLFAQLTSPQNDLGAFVAPSLVAAYLGGVLSIISPCTVVVFPAFFAITFQEKKKITRALTIFFLGLLSVFVPLGISASFLAQTFLAYRSAFLVAAGLLLILFGMMAIFGKGFKVFHAKPLMENNHPGSVSTGKIFWTGALAAFGAGGCAAAIYGGILTLAASSNMIWYGTFLLVIFAFGLITPLYVLSVYFDKINIAEIKWIKGRLFQIRLQGKEYKIHSTNLMAGLLLIFMGLAFILWKGTTVFLPIFDRTGLLDIYYNLNEWLQLNF